MKYLLFLLLLIGAKSYAQETTSAAVSGTIVITDEKGNILGKIPESITEPIKMKAIVILYWKSGDVTIVTDSANYQNYRLHQKQLVSHNRYYRKQIRRIK